MHSQGGLISAQSGHISTTHGPRMSVLWGDNPGGQETHAFIPHNDPGPTMSRLGKMFGDGGDGNITMNATFGIDGNDIVNSKEIKRQVKADLGRNRWKFG